MSLRDKERGKNSCYEKAEGIPAIRVELENGESYVLPYIHFQFARKRLIDGEHFLEIQFSTHHLQVLGCGLQTLLVAIQKAELAVLFQSVKGRTKGGGTVVRSIIVKAMIDEPTDEDRSETGTT